MAIVKEDTRVSFRTRKGKRGMIRYPIKEKVLVVTTECGLQFAYKIEKERT